MSMYPGEMVIWESYFRDKYTTAYTITLIVLGVILLATIYGAIFGIALIVGAILMRHWIVNGRKYVVTNMRAMRISHGKVVRETPLNIPNLIVTLGDSESIYTGHTSVFGLHSGTSYEFTDIVFIQNGMELLRFEKVSTGKARELLTKLHSMGIQTYF